MAEKTPLEIVFYIHGVSPSQVGKPHIDEYTQLHRGIAAAKVAAEWPDQFGGAEWGWNFDDGGLLSHKALTQSQNKLGEPLLKAIKEQRDFTINPARLVVNGLRELMFYGFGDMFYYVSADGKSALRHQVAAQILQHLDEQREELDHPVSLTLIGHSAGSVIAFDFLYYVFSQRNHRYLSESSDDATRRGMERLREMAASGQLRLRRLITLGSPISLVAFRSDAVVEILSRGEKLRPADYGLSSSLEGQAELPGVRWINIWDKDDPIAFPIGPLMDSPLAEDVYIDVSPLGLDKRGRPLPPSPSHRPRRGEGRCDGEGGRGSRKPCFRVLAETSPSAGHTAKEEEPVSARSSLKRCQNRDCTGRRQSKLQGAVHPAGNAVGHSAVVAEWADRLLHDSDGTASLKQNSRRG